MKRGRIRTAKDYENGGFKIQGKKNGVWSDVWDDPKSKKLLKFDLEYDACFYIEALFEWIADHKNGTFRSARIATGKTNAELKSMAKKNRKRNNKQSKLSRKRNRK